MWRQWIEWHLRVLLFPAANGAAHSPQAAVKMNDATASGALVQRIHVLRNQNIFLCTLFKFRQRAVPGIGFALRMHRSPPVVPLPNKLRVTTKRFWRGQLFRPEISPQSARPAKRRQTALGGNSRSREHSNGPGLHDPIFGFSDTHLLLRPTISTRNASGRAQACQTLRRADSPFAKACFDALRAYPYNRVPSRDRGKLCILRLITGFSVR